MHLATYVQQLSQCKSTHTHTHIPTEFLWVIKLCQQPLKENILAPLPKHAIAYVPKRLLSAMYNFLEELLKN